MKTLATQTSILPGDAYCPGRIRSAADAEAGAVDAFIHEHPEYRRLPLAIVQQVMNSATRQDAQAAALRHDEGIPDDWCTRREDEGGPRLSEEG